METLSLYKPNNSLGPIGSALKSITVRNAEDFDLRTLLAKSIATAFQDSGQASNANDASYLIETMLSEVKKNFPNIRINEIPIAIEKGIRKEFGQYFGLNVLSFSSFIQSYLESAERINAVKEFQKTLEPVKHTPSPEEVQEGIRKAIVNAYNTFVEKGFYEDYGNFIYDKMDEMGLISLSVPRKTQIYQQAQLSIANKKNPLQSVNRQEFKEFTKVLELVNNPDSILGKDMIKKEAKKIALQIVFKDFLEVETNINELVDQKRDF